MQAHADAVLRVCMLHSINQQQAEDAFQETFLKYAKTDTDFNDEEHKRAWLIRVATNTCIDMARSAEAKNVAFDVTQEQAGEDTTEAEALADMQSEELRRALLTLDEKYRTVLYLKFFEGYTASEIGEILGIPKNTVYTNIARAKEKLKEVLTYE